MIVLGADNWNTRIGTSQRLRDREDGIVYVHVTNNGAGESVRLNFSPDDARRLSSKLKRWADALDPPKPRKARVAA